MKGILFLMLLVCITPSLWAQAPFRDGYIVKTGDTLRGQLEDGLLDHFMYGIRFKDKTNGETQLGVSDVSAFGFADGRIYRKLKFVNPLDSGRVDELFAKLILGGGYALYAYDKEDFSYFLVVRKDTTFVLYDDLRRGDGSIKRPGNFKKQLLYLSYGCYGISQERVERLFYAEKDLANFLTDVLRCKNESVDAQAYLKSTPLESKLYLFGGRFPGGAHNEITASAFYRFYMPTRNINICVNIGMDYGYRFTKDYYQYIYTKYDGYVYAYGVFGSMQFFFTKGIVRPFVSGGLGFGVWRRNEKETLVYDHKQFRTSINFTPLGSVGLEAQLGSRVMIRADWPYQYVGHYPTLGIGYRVL